jgi:hypothetical protein
MTVAGSAPRQRRQTRLPAAAIERTIDLLVAERQRLREIAAPRDRLESNRCAIAYWHRELAEARRPEPAATA